MIGVKIVDGEGTGKEMNVGQCGEIPIVIHQHPPRMDDEVALPFRQYFTDTGSIGGSNTLAVNGASTPVDFYIKAIDNFDIYIKYISVEIGDGGTPALNKFGALSALSNGVGWYWFTNSLGEYELHEGIKTNKEFIRVGTDTAAIGTGTDAYLADVSGGGTEKSYLPSIDIRESYGLYWGLKLTKSSLDKVIFRVRDDLTGLSTFNIVAYGIRI